MDISQPASMPAGFDFAEFCFAKLLGILRARKRKKNHNGARRITKDAQRKVCIERLKAARPQKMPHYGMDAVRAQPCPAPDLGVPLSIFVVHIL
jgi:hypothetical protein